MAVEPHNTRPTTNGISTAAVTTRFHVIERESPANSQASSHHIEGNKSRGTNIPQVFCTGSVSNYENLPGAGGAVVIPELCRELASRDGPTAGKHLGTLRILV